MTPREAEQTLATIRTLMERGTRYTNISSASAVAAGLVTLAGCAVRAAGLPGLSNRASFFVTWAGVFVVSLAATIWFTFAQARRNGEYAWTRQAKTVVVAILPTFFAAAVLSHVMFW